jgi:hypothetical protein
LRIGWWATKPKEKQLFSTSISIANSNGCISSDVEKFFVRRKKEIRKKGDRQDGERRAREADFVGD